MPVPLSRTIRRIFDLYALNSTSTGEKCRFSIICVNFESSYSLSNSLGVLIYILGCWTKTGAASTGTISTSCLAFLGLILCISTSLLVGPLFVFLLPAAFLPSSGDLWIAFYSSLYSLLITYTTYVCIFCSFIVCFTTLTTLLSCFSCDLRIWYERHSLKRLYKNTKRVPKLSP